MAQDADVAIGLGQGSFNGGGQRRPRGFRDIGAATREGDGKHVIFQFFRANAGKSRRLGRHGQRDKRDAKHKHCKACHAGSRISAVRSFSISAAALTPGQAKASEVSVMLGWVMIQAAGSTSCAVIAKTPISVRSP